MGRMLMHLVTDIHRCVWADEEALTRTPRAGEGGESCANYPWLLLCVMSKDHPFIHIQKYVLEPWFIPDTRMAAIGKDVRMTDMCSVPIYQQEWEQYFLV
jgi:hypothetical protein